MTSPVLSIQSLSVALPAGGDRVHAVHEVSLQIEAGRTLCVVGESGSGKSVMATTVMGLLDKALKPVAGQVLLKGESLLDASPARLRELLEQAGKADVPPLPGPMPERLRPEMEYWFIYTPVFLGSGAERLRPEMEVSRAKLLEQAKAWLDAQSKDGTLDVADVVQQFWPKLLNEIVTWEKHFRRATIAHGVLWIVALEIILALLCAVSRALRAPVETESATPPKLN